VSDALHARIPEPPDEPFALAQLAKKYASSACDLAVAPDLRAVALDRRGMRRLYTLWFGAVGLQVLAIQIIFLALALLGPFVALVSGAMSLALFPLQPLLAPLGGALRPPARLLAAVLRAPLDLARTVAVAATPEPPRPDLVAPLRPIYAELVADGIDRFFEP